MRRICEEHYQEEMELIKSIPGISEISTMILIAEIGGDMSVFEHSGNITGLEQDCAQETTKAPTNTKAPFFHSTVFFC